MVVLRWGCGGGKSKSLPHPFFPTAFFRKESGAAGGRASFGRADDIRPYRAWRCGWAAAAIYGGPTGSHDGSWLPVTLRRLRASCHAAGWAHGRVAKSGLREKCRSGLCPSPVFSSAPCLSSPMRLLSALLVVTLRLFATPGFPPAPGTNSQFANWPGLYPSLRSIRAAHDGSALLFRQFPQKFFRNLLKRAKRTGIIERQCM